MIFDRQQQVNWYNHPFDICLNQLTMCKKSWCDGLERERGCLHKGGGTI